MVHCVVRSVVFIEQLLHAVMRAFVFAFALLLVVVRDALCRLGFCAGGRSAFGWPLLLLVAWLLRASSGRCDRLAFGLPLSRPPAGALQGWAASLSLVGAGGLYIYVSCFLSILPEERLSFWSPRLS